MKNLIGVRQVSLKERWEGELALFLFNFFKVYHFYIWKLFYPLQNCVMHSKKKKFSATIILWKKVIRRCLKMNLKITFSIVNNPYPLHTYMLITETCSLKFTIISFWGPALKSTAENGIPKKPLDTSLLQIFFNLLSASPTKCSNTLKHWVCLTILWCWRLKS